MYGSLRKSIWFYLACLAFSMLSTVHSEAQAGFIGKRFYADVYYASFPVMDIWGPGGFNYGFNLGYAITDRRSVSVFHERISRSQIQYATAVTGFNIYTHGPGQVSPVGKAWYSSLRFYQHQGEEAIVGANGLEPQQITEANISFGIGHESRIPIAQGRWYIRTNVCINRMLLPDNFNSMQSSFAHGHYLLSLRLGFGKFFGRKPHGKRQ